MKKVILLIALLLVPFIINAQELTLKWQNIFGGNDEEKFSDFVVTETGDIISYGYTNSTNIDGLSNKGSYDAVIVKYDKNGTLLWQRNYGGSSSDSFSNIIVTKNNDIIALGYTDSTDIDGLTTKGYGDAFIVKYDENGKLLWQKSFSGSEYEIFYDSIITESEDIIIYGYTDSTDIDGLITNGYGDGFIVKYDKNGNLLWQNSFGGSDYDEIGDFRVTENEEIIIYADTYSEDIEGLTSMGYSDAVIAKYSKDGTLLWQRIMVEVMKSL